MSENTTENYPLLNLLRVRVGELKSFYGFGIPGVKSSEYYILDQRDVVDITAKLLAVSVHRGVVRNGPQTNADVGTMTLTFRESGPGFWDTPQFHRGQWIGLETAFAPDDIPLAAGENNDDTIPIVNADGSFAQHHKPDPNGLFSGTVDSVTVVPDDSADSPKNSRILTVNATDDVSKLSNTQLKQLIAGYDAKNYNIAPGHMYWRNYITALQKLADPTTNLRAGVSSLDATTYIYKL